MQKSHTIAQNENLHVSKIEVPKFFYYYFWTQGTWLNGKKWRTHQNVKKVKKWDTLINMAKIHFHFSLNVQLIIIAFFNFLKKIYFIF